LNEVELKTFPPRFHNREIARLTARMLIEVGAIDFSSAIHHASGKKAPTLCGLPQADLVPAYPLHAWTFWPSQPCAVGFEAFDNIAGSEGAAGIPLAH
jgi:orotate phosphoribosyltransferase